MKADVKLFTDPKDPHAARLLLKPETAEESAVLARLHNHVTSQVGRLMDGEAAFVTAFVGEVRLRERWGGLVHSKERRLMFFVKWAHAEPRAVPPEVAEEVEFDG